MTSWLPSSSCPSQLQVRSSYRIYCFYPRLRRCSLLSLKTTRTFETGLVLTLLPSPGWVYRLSCSFGASRQVALCLPCFSREGRRVMSVHKDFKDEACTHQWAAVWVCHFGPILRKMVPELITAKLWHSSGFHSVNHYQTFPKLFCWNNDF